MTIIDEYEVFASYVGEFINVYKLENLASITLGVGSYKDCEEFCIRLNDLCKKDKFLDNYLMVDEWVLNEVIVEVYLYIKKSILIGGHVLKYKLISNFIYRMDPTQAEMQLINRVLKMILKEDFI